MRGCGLHERVGAGDPLTIQVMCEVGLDLRVCLPQLVQPEMVEHADFIVFMGRDVRLRALGPTHVWDFAAAPRRSLDDLRVLRDRIRERVQRLLAEIEREERTRSGHALGWEDVLPNGLT